VRRTTHAKKGACRTGKVRFRDEVEARRALSRARWRREKIGDQKRQETRPYPCQFCKGWHLTSKEMR
jgi:hypothetical protein